MKSFRGYLEEAQAGFNTKDMIFTNADTPALILSPTALERAFGGLERIKAWHVTDLTGLKGLKRLQGKKSSISVMTEVEPSSLNAFNGVETGGGFLVELEGTELVSMDQDVWSERLEGGRRGISVTKDMFPHMYRHLEFMVKKMYEKFSNKPYPKNSRQGGFVLNQLAKELSQKEKGQFIKEYIDNCEDILKKNKRAQGELRKYGRARLLQGSPGVLYNESIVNQISIKNVYVIMEKWEEFGRTDWGSEGDDELEKIKSVWKDVQIKSQKELVTLVNKK